MYKTLIQKNISRFKGDESVMWASVEKINQWLEKIKDTHPNEYWSFQRDQHEIMCGKHFDKAYAEWEVAQMMHLNAEGKVCKGEHWGIEDVMRIYAKHKTRIPNEYTEWDVYVALNAHWHDTWCIARAKFATEDVAEEYIIEEAIYLWLLDADWGSHDKPWVYFRAKNENNQ